MSSSSGIVTSGMIGTCGVPFVAVDRVWNTYAVMPSARMLIAVPHTIWSARRWIEKKACTNAISPPAAIAPSIPIAHESALSQTKTPQNAARQHHALEADVDDAGALRHESAEGREHERRGVA